MNRFSAALLFLVFVATAVFAAASERSLVVVTDPAPDLTARLVDRGVMVVRDLDEVLLVAASPEDRVRLEEENAAWLEIEPSVEGKNFYSVAVHGHGAGSFEEAASDVRVLWRRGAIAVVEGPAEGAERLPMAGYHIAKVFLKTIRMIPERETGLVRKAAVADPVIQALVDSVSESSITGYVQRLQDFKTRYARSDSCQAAANWLKAKYESFGIDSVYFHHFDGEIKDNVVAVIPGVTDPSKIVVIGGHYDSITGNHNNAPGADDDASGTACALECARVLSKYRYDYTLVFMAWGGEELGLIGSHAYADLAAQRGEDIIGVVAVDMIGYLAPGDVIDLDIVSNPSSAFLRDLVMDVGQDYVPGFSIVDGAIPGGASSDHASFWAAGFPAILFFEDTGEYSPYIHSSNDKVGISYNSGTLVVNSVRTAAALLATLAGPYQVALEHTPLANTADTANPYRVAADIEAPGGLNPDSLIARYAVTGGGTGEALLMATGNGNEYEGFIPAQPGGTTVGYWLVAEDADGDRAVSPLGAPSVVHSFFVGEIATFLADDFESESGWTAGAPDDDALEGIWERADPNGTWYDQVPVQPEDDHTDAPGTFCFVTGNADPGEGQRANEVNGGKTTLLSPVYDLSGLPNAGVRYRRWYSNDTGFLDPDVWRVDVSSDGGETWVNLETEPRSDRRWVLVERKIDDYVPLTSQVVFRFVAEDSNYPTVVEAGVDDFEIVVFEEVATDVAAGALPAPARARLARNVPNPFNPATRITFTLPEGGARVSLRIYDVTGRLVRTLVDGVREAGGHSVSWNGADDRGRSAASGVYFSRLTWKEQSETERMVLLR
ncbi:MAG: M20/M25/M40 family metallo-hydrolase [Candidatus Eisenbacteria bacterium]